MATSTYPSGQGITSAENITSGKAGAAGPQGTSFMGPITFQVLSAQFLIDLGHVTKQDPYIKIKIGLHKERTNAKTRAGKSATWNETLTFNRLERGTQDHMVHISARDKNILRDNIIGKTSIPLSELLRHQGQREIDLFGKNDASKLTGRVLINITDQGLSGHDTAREHDTGLTSSSAHYGPGLGASTAAGGALGAAAASTGVGRQSLHENLVIQVHSAQFTRDLDPATKQDPYIKITVGHQTEKTSAKNGAGRNAVWNENLTFTKLDKLTERKSHDEIISARDKDVVKDDEIGNVEIPLSELLRAPGQLREFDLFHPKDVRQVVGRISLTAIMGQGIGDNRSHGLGAGGLAGLMHHDAGPSTGSSTGIAGAGTGASYGMGAGSTGMGTSLMGAGHDGRGPTGMSSTGMGSSGIGSSGIGSSGVGSSGMSTAGMAPGMGAGSTGAGTTMLGAGHDGMGPTGSAGHVLGTGLPGHIGSTRGSGNVAITVHSAQFVTDIGTLAKQDPYIMISLGGRTLKTKTINRGGKSVVWDETLNFTGLGGLEAKNPPVNIRARDSDVIKDDDIGHVTLPLSELLSYQGQQREYELFDASRRSVGRVWLTVSHGEHLASAATRGQTY